MQRGHYRRYSDEQRAQVMCALLLGESPHTVAKRFKMPRTTVRHWRREAFSWVSPEVRAMARAALQVVFRGQNHASTRRLHQ